MSSVTKALGLLSHFSSTQPEIGLSRLCRMAKRDKATTFRYLQALEASGFVEQNPQTKQYRLGPGLLHLAQIREDTVPRKDGAQPAMRKLAEKTGETAHVSVLSGMTLFSLTSCESPKHATRAIIDINVHPLHATASGLCTLAFGPEALFDAARNNLEGFTDSTPLTDDALSAMVRATRDSGFGNADQTYETEIHGISAPIFDQSDAFAGTVAVASVASRFTPALAHIIRSELVIASREITRNWGGTVPASVEAAWAASLSSSSTLESTS